MADATPDSAPSSNRNLMIVLSYLWFLALVPLLSEKEDQEVQWHAKHGLMLMVTELFLMVVMLIMIGPLGIYGCVIFGLILPSMFMLGVLGLHAMCIVKGLNGQRLIIPGFSPLADKF